MNNSRIKLAYFGTPVFSAHVLERVLAELTDVVEVKYVVTQPDMPVGRKQVITASPVKEVALAHNIKVEHEINLDALHELDLVLLFAYGKIIRADQLAEPKHGFWNIHLSLLPAFRGATPTVFPLILGHTSTGTTLTKMDSELDHGPIIAQHSREIEPDNTNFELINTLANDSFELFKEIVRSHQDLSGIKMHDQDHSLATYTKTLTRNDGFIELDFVVSALKNEPTATVPAILKDHVQHRENPAETTHNLWRGLTPWPGIWTTLKDGKRLKILECSLENGALHIKKVQVEGKNPTDFSTLLLG